ncbi:MAG: polysaccharide deacetylase family protein [Oscillospiraceae bacterium]|nr:polysaccharide deacetylase family protein [Oscillospiraceae bacterium]
MEEKRVQHIPRERFSDQLERKIYPMFPGGRRKVFTLSYDDSQTCDRPLVEMMRKYGVKGTFNVNSAQNLEDGIPAEKRPWRPMSLAECVELYGDDMEIAIHGAHHPYWDRMPSAQAMADILEDRRNLEKATGKIIRGAAYPYGSYTEDVLEILRLLDIQYCRGVDCSKSTKLSAEPDWLRLQPTCWHGDPELMQIAEDFLRVGGYFLHMLYVYGHTHEFVVDDNWQVMEALLKKVSNREDIWYATNIEIVEYMKASRQLIYNLDQTLVRNPTDLDIWLRIMPKDITVCVPAGKTVTLPE